MNFLLSEPGAEPIVVESWLRAAPTRVFRAWTTPNEVMKWFGYKPNSLSNAEIDLRPGGAWRFAFPADDEKEDHGFEGVYEAIEPDEKLVFSWRRFIRYRAGGEEYWPYSRVEVSFAPKGAGTQLRVHHSALSDQEKRVGVGGGWNGAFGNLVDLLGGGLEA